MLTPCDPAAPTRTATDDVPTRTGAPARPACALEARTFMRHFSCDLCGKDLTPGSETRYVVRMESFPAGVPGELTEADLDEDHLEAMAEMLDELEAREEVGAGPATTPVPDRRSAEYDLCPGCYRKFAADPLGHDRGRKPHFSKN